MEASPRRGRLGWLIVALTIAAAFAGGLAVREFTRIQAANSLEPAEVGGRKPALSPDVADDAGSPPASQSEPPPEPALQAVEEQRRTEMVERQLRARDITDHRVLDVMGKVPRHCFVPGDIQRLAYADQPLQIGHGQTISQPYIVALMTQLAAPRPNERALDIGTGSGYQAAVLACLCKEVYSIEIVPQLADEAEKRLADMGYKNITVRCGDGYRGWKEHGPFDVIVVAASPNHVPQPLIDQLARGGRLVIPVGGYPQDLLLIVKEADGTIRRKSVAPVLFVPMTGEAREK